MGMEPLLGSLKEVLIGLIGWRSGGLIDFNGGNESERRDHLRDVGDVMFKDVPLDNC